MVELHYSCLVYQASKNRWSPIKNDDINMLLVDYLTSKDIIAVFYGMILWIHKSCNRISAPRIMVVDDSEDILLTIKTGLDKENFNIDIFNSAKSALEARTPIS